MGQSLNTGGIALTPQEIRDCVFRGKFADFLDEMAEDQNFNSILHLTNTQKSDGTKEECVLRFFAYYHRYKSFVHSVVGFLNEYMKDASKTFDYRSNEKLFRRTFLQLATLLPNGIQRPRRRGTTSLILFEAIAVGAAMALQQISQLPPNLDMDWLDSDTLREHTTGYTNSPVAVVSRIEFCRDRFLGL